MRIVRASGFATCQAANLPKNALTKSDLLLFHVLRVLMSAKFTSCDAWVPMANGKPAPITPKLPLVMKVRGLGHTDWGFTPEILHSPEMNIL